MRDRFLRHDEFSFYKGKDYKGSSTGIRPEYSFQFFLPPKKRIALPVLDSIPEQPEVFAGVVNFYRDERYFEYNVCSKV